MLTRGIPPVAVSYHVIVPPKSVVTIKSLTVALSQKLCIGSPVGVGVIALNVRLSILNTLSIFL